MQRANSYYELRLRRELRQEREDRKFWEQMTMTMGIVAAMATGVLLAVANMAGML